MASRRRIVNLPIHNPTTGQYIGTVRELPTKTSPGVIEEPNGTFREYYSDEEWISYFDASNQPSMNQPLMIEPQYQGTYVVPLFRMDSNDPNSTVFDFVKGAQSRIATNQNIEKYMNRRATNNIVVTSTGKRKIQQLPQLTASEVTRPTRNQYEFAPYASSFVVPQEVNLQAVLTRQSKRLQRNTQNAGGLNKNKKTKKNKTKKKKQKRKQYRKN